MVDYGFTMNFRLRSHQFWRAQCEDEKTIEKMLYGFNKILAIGENLTETVIKIIKRNHRGKYIEMCLTNHLSHSIPLHSTILLLLFSHSKLYK